MVNKNYKEISLIVHLRKKTWQCLEKLTGYVNNAFSAKLEEDIK